MAELKNRTEAVYILIPGSLINSSTVHSYPYNWYANTIEDPGKSEIGFRYSFEMGTMDGAPNLGTVYVQRSPDNAFLFDRFAPDEDFNSALDQYSIARRYKFFDDKVITPLKQIKDNIVSVAGRAVADWTEARSSADYTPLFMLYKDLNTNPSPLAKSRSLMPDEMNYSACVWVPITISNNVAGMSFEFQFQNTLDGDYLVVGINDTNLFNFESSFVTNGAMVTSGIIDVSQWAGQQVELFMGLFGTGSTNGSVAIQGIHFYAAASPPLKMTCTNNVLLLSWPVAAYRFVLETATNLAPTNIWSTVTNLPVLVDDQITVTNALSGSSIFYRLRYAPDQ